MDDGMMLSNGIVAEYMKLEGIGGELW